MVTVGTSFAIFLDKSTEVWPCELSSNKLQGFVESEMSCKNMVMFISEDAQMKVSRIRNPDLAIASEKAIGVCPAGVHRT